MEILNVCNITYLYTLNDPITGEVRYVGKSGTPYKRFTQHLSRSKKNNTYKNNWISSLINEGKKQSKHCIESKYKPIIQMDGDNNIIKSWVSIKSVTDEIGINRNSLRMVCNGDIKTAGGFKWKWKNEQI